LWRARPSAFDHPREENDMRTALTVCCLVAVAGSAQAGSVTNVEFLDLFGQSYRVTSWNVQADAGAGLDFEPEGMTFFDGRLFATTDFGNAQNRMVEWTPGPSGNLSSPLTIQIDLATPWGAEGLTVNFSGSGYGSYAGNDFVFSSGDSENEQLGIIDPNVNPATVTGVTAPGSYNLDDITYVDDNDAFAIILDEVEDIDGNVIVPQRVAFYDKMDLSNELYTFQTIPDVKGITTLSRSAAELLTGQSLATGDYLAIVAETNDLVITDLLGNQIGGVQSFKPTDVVEIESIAYDERFNVLYFGDEGAETIYAVNIPAPGSALALGLLAPLGLRRRR
jgi:hypothetical protein